jgi:hypothetical protein
MCKIITFVLNNGKVQRNIEHIQTCKIITFVLNNGKVQRNIECEVLSQLC